MSECVSEQREDTLRLAAVRSARHVWWLGAILGLALGCARRAPNWPPFDALAQPRPAPARAVAGVPVSEADYRRVLRWGADWFRYETFGGERMITDVVGFLNAPIDVPCSAEHAGRQDCFRREWTASYFVRAIDDLDGVRGNLYTGNGGFDGPGYTHDLTLRFPRGSRLHDLPLPEEVHTGLDVEAGAAWPIGISPVAAEGADEKLPYVWDLPRLSGGQVEGPKHVRVGITCALCHYSLDVDWDGRTDLKSADIDRPTPGSPYRPEHAWAIGNQDLKVGWLFAMSQNPLVGYSIFSGPIGDSHDADAALAWVEWVKQNYRTSPRAVVREVVRGMLLQPRGYADVSSNARFNASQFPPLYTQHYWPSNSDGSVLNGADRNSVVWTSTMDFSGLVGLANDRGGSSQLYWEPKNIYSAFSARELAELMVYGSPAGLLDARRRDELRDDILGVSDGVPGLLDPSSVYVMRGPPSVIPNSVLEHPNNRRDHRIRQASDFGGDAAERGAMLALLGLRVHTRPRVAAALGLDDWLKRYPKIRGDELTGEAVNTMLDWQPSPPNLSVRLARARNLLPRGAALFEGAGCARCHSGPFFSDNAVHRVSVRRADEVGIAAPSTAGFRSLGRGAGPGIGSEPERTYDSRLLTLYVSPAYDANTGQAVAAGNPLRGLFGTPVVGYKTTQLRYLWGSAPYLHDGGVGIAVAPASQVDRDDLARVLALPAEQKVYGMGSILAYGEADPSHLLRADAALSLQALVLRSERERVVAHNQELVMPVPGVGQSENPFGAPPFVSATQLGISGIGHEFYIEDTPGGERVTALVAYLLALDDDAGEQLARGK